MAKPFVHFETEGLGNSLSLVSVVSAGVIQESAEPVTLKGFNQRRYVEGLTSPFALDRFNNHSKRIKNGTEYPIPAIRFQVLLPTYNASRWFEAALRSVVGHPDGEVLVLDDGSDADERDAIAAICERYRGVRFFSLPHRGIAATLNTGLSLTTAPYIARMDADDISLPGRFDRQIAFLDSHPNIAVIGGQMIGIDDKGRPNGKSTRYPTDPQSSAKLLSKGRNPLMHPSVMMRRDALLAVGGYRPATERAEDYDLWLRLAERFGIANVKEPLIHYRRHEKQITRSTNWKQKFAHDLGTLSAQRRRANQPDPISAFQEPLQWDLHYTEADSDIRHLMAAYRAVEDKHNDQPLSSETIRWVLQAVDRGLVGRSSKPQARVATRIAKLAWRRNEYPSAIIALIKGLKLNPLICLRTLNRDF